MWIATHILATCLFLVNWLFQLWDRASIIYSSSSSCKRCNSRGPRPILFTSIMSLDHALDGAGAEYVPLSSMTPRTQQHSSGYSGQVLTSHSPIRAEKSYGSTPSSSFSFALVQVNKV